MKYPKLRKAAIWFGAFLGLLTLARETGTLALNYYRTNINANTQCQSKTSTTTFHVASSANTASPSSLVVSAETSDSKSNQLAKALTAELQKRQITGAVKVAVKEWSLSGFWWIPLRKSGTLKFSVSCKIITGNAMNQKDCDDLLSGTISCEATGICSAYEYCDSITGEVASNLAERIQTDLK